MRNLNQTTSTNFQILPPDFETQHSGKLRPTFSLEEDRLVALRQILPEAFADGKINFETLRELLGEKVEDERDEHFGLSWTGKKEARRLAGLPSKGTLVPTPGEGVDEATTENIFIEGDNLEVLKLLHKSYRGRVKMIYIDPPYNTGNDFIYKDDFRESEESYLQRSGQMSDVGERYSSNSKKDGRFHSNWLNMIYPRLRVARDLLREDGVIFVSIDENEAHNLQQAMNEIFGEENFVANVSVISNWKGRSDDKYIATAHESLLIYQKGEFVSFGLPLLEEYLGDYPERNEDGIPFRYLGLRKRGSGARREDRPKMFYPFYANSRTGKVSLLQSAEFSIEILPRLSDGSDGRWRWGRDTSKDRIDELAAKKVSGTDRYDVFQIDCAEIEGEARRIKPKSIWNEKSFSNEAGTLEYKALMGAAKFSNPKSPDLIKCCLQQATGENDLVLDFFSGSGTTAQSVLELNKEDNKKRKFICVQIPEETPENSEAKNAGYDLISEVSKERIRKVCNRIKSDNKELSPLLKQTEEQSAPQDLGFKVFRLERSNFRAWTDFTGQEFSEFRPLLESAETPFVAEATHDGILNEILLLEGFPLNSNVALDSHFERNKVYYVTSEFSEHHLYITLDDEVWEETIDNASELDKNDIFICLDNSLNDESKIRLADVCRLKTI